MENAVKLFESAEFGKVRVVLREGEPWFVARDVCAILEIVNVADAVDSLDTDERATIGKNDSLNNMDGLRSDSRLVSESGLYSLIFRSRKPEAKAFRKWVTSEVLPSIRKIGGYNKSSSTGTINPMDAVTFDNMVCILTKYANTLNSALSGVSECLHTLNAMVSGSSTSQAPHSQTKKEISIGHKMSGTTDARKEDQDIPTDCLERVKSVSHGTDPVGDRWCRVRDISWLNDVFVPSKGMFIVVGKYLGTLSRTLDYRVHEEKNVKYGTISRYYHPDIVETFRVYLDEHPKFMLKYRRVS